MSGRRATVTQTEMERSIKAAVAAGLAVARVEVDHRQGKVLIFTPDAPSSDGPNPWDEVLK